MDGVGRELSLHHRKSVSHSHQLDLMASAAWRIIEKVSKLASKAMVEPEDSGGGA